MTSFDVRRARQLLDQLADGARERFAQLEPSWTLVAVLSAMIVMLAARLWWSDNRARRATRARLGRALAGERDAEALLISNDYQIEARQERALWWIEVDGVEVEAEVRADFIVSRDGRKFVAEVKTGALAVEPTHPQTRRQLLEYRFVFGTEELLLVDPEASLIRHVRFLIHDPEGTE